jgi:hypothetical protein
MLQRTIILQCSKKILPLIGSLWPNMLQGSTRHVPPVTTFRGVSSQITGAARDGGLFLANRDSADK